MGKGTAEQKGHVLSSQIIERSHGRRTAGLTHGRHSEIVTAKLIAMIIMTMSGWHVLDMKLGIPCVHSHFLLSSAPGGRQDY